MSTKFKEFKKNRPVSELLDIERAVADAFGEGKSVIYGVPHRDTINWRISLEDGTSTYVKTHSEVTIEQMLEVTRLTREGQEIPDDFRAPDYEDAEIISFADKAKEKVSSFLGGSKKSRTKVEVERDRTEVTPALRERALELEISEKDIEAGGGLRQGEYGAKYWLNLEQLIELEELDLAITDDKKFWDEFRALIDRNGIKSEAASYSWSGSSKSYSVKNWWNDWGWGSSHGSEEARRLALAQGMIATTVGVINDTPNSWHVELASNDDRENPVNVTMFEDRKVLVSPQALLDKSLSEDQQIEISTGYGLHEGSHVQHTEPLIPVLKNPTVLRPIAVAQMLLNIAEDVRIEHLTMEKYPGFVSYFGTMHEYLWNLVSSKLILKWEGELTDKLSAVIAFAKWPENYEKLIDDANMIAELDWWKAWTVDYKTGAIDARTTIERGLERLAEDPKTQAEMEAQSKAEEEIEKAMGKMLEAMSDPEFQKALEEALEKLEKEGKVIKSCPSPKYGDPSVGKPGGAGQIDGELKEQIKRLLDEEFQVEKVPLPAAMGPRQGPEFQVRKPVQENPAAKVVQHPILARLRHAFKFRKARPMYSNRLLRSGSLDEEEVWRVGAKDFRVFEQRVIETDPDTQVTLLVDCSGSMSGRHIKTAETLTQVMLECLKDMKGVRVRVRGHNSETYGQRVTGGGVCNIYRIWEPGDQTKRIKLLSEEIELTANYDGFAIAWCAEELLKNQRPNEDMVLIVLSDGLPAGGTFPYGGPSAMMHMKQVSKHYGSKGVTIIQIAIDPAVGPEYQAQMFDHFIPFSSYDTIPQQLTKLLIKLFGGE